MIALIILNFRKLFIYGDAGTEDERESYLPGCLHFKDTALKSLKKQFWVVDLHLRGQRKDL